MEMQDKKISFHFFEQKIGIPFYDKRLLKQAFTHSSYSNENKDTAVNNNERLEFLGDSVIQLIVTNELYRRFPGCREGLLTNYRSALVNTSIFTEIAQELGIETYLMMSGISSERKHSPRHILADTFEALVGAIFLDQGYSVTETFVKGWLLQRIEGIVHRGLWRDWKTLLQEKAQKYLQITPIYEVTEETGPSNDKIFTVAVKLDTKIGQQGTGKSKKDAEKDAAHKMLQMKGWL